MGPLSYYLNGPPTIIVIQEAQAPLNFMFANQFKRTTRVKLKAVNHPANYGGLQ